MYIGLLLSAVFCAFVVGCNAVYIGGNDNHVTLDKEIAAEIEIDPAIEKKSEVEK